MGKLIATAENESTCAGIGGVNSGDGGTITINGGEVRATGGDDGIGAFPGDGGAGIGGGHKGNGGNITICGGKVTAQGGGDAAGIGGGDYGNGDNITINGGHVEATGGGTGAGIGGGDAGNGGTITIRDTLEGTHVEATGGNHGAGIGGGVNGYGGNITIEGGTIIAKAGGDTTNTNSGGAGIGGGGCVKQAGGGGGNIAISGGTVEATGKDGGAGIGAGKQYNSEDPATITLNPKTPGKAPEITASSYVGTLTLTGDFCEKLTGGSYGAVIDKGVVSDAIKGIIGGRTIVPVDGTPHAIKSSIIPDSTDISLAVSVNDIPITQALKGTSLTLVVKGIVGEPVRFALSGATYGGNTVLVPKNGVFIMPDADVTLSLTQWAWLQQTIDEAAKMGNILAITLPFDVQAQAWETALVVPAGEPVTIDLNGHKIDRALKNAVDGGNAVTVEGTLTVVDGSSEKTGNITGGNNNNGGGGVIVDGGTFSMSGGRISGNSASQGGGVCVTGGAFNMSGGEISGNTAAAAGGGIGFMGGALKLSGSPSVTGNTVGGKANNLWADSAKPFTVTGALGENASVGVNLWQYSNGSYAPATGAFAKATEGYAITANDIARFTSDDAYGIGFTSAGAAALKDICTLSFSIEDWTYDGSAHVPVPTVTGASAGEVAFTYYKDAACSTVTTTADGASGAGGAPKNKGDYWVKADVVETDAHLSAAAAKSFTIAPKALTVKADDASKIVGEADPTLTYTVTGLVDSDTLTGALTREAGEAVGTYAITQGTLEASDNYAMTFTGATFIIKVKTAVDVKIGDGVPPMTIEGLTEALAQTLVTPEEWALLEAGASLMVYLDIENIDATVSEADKKNIIAAALKLDPAARVGMYLDLSMYKKIGDDYPTKVVDLNGQKIRFTIYIPEELRKPGRRFFIVRLHELLAQIIGEGTGESVMGESDLFSTYALIYVDEEAAPAPTPVPADPDVTLLAEITASGDNAMTLSWTEASDADGYDVFFAQCNGQYELIQTVTGSCSFNIEGLINGETYKAYVRAWKKENGAKTYIGTESPPVYAIAGGFTKTKTDAGSVTVKTTELTLVKGKSKTVRCTVKDVKPRRSILARVKKLRYYSSDRNVATVTSTGKIKAKGGGTCTIYVIANNGVRASVKVTVVDQPTKIAFRKSSYSVKMGRTLKLAGRTKLTPSGVTTTYTWSSSDPTIAAVSAKGVVKGIKKGTVTITATSANGKTATTNVKVK